MIAGTAPSSIAGLPKETPGPRLAIDNDECGEKRLRILNRATQAFLVHGLEGANLEDIAIAAGVGKVTIYRYFNDKADLFAQVVIEAVTMAARPLRSLLRTDRPVEEVLTDFAEAHAARMLRPVAGSRPFFEMVRMLIGTSLKHPQLARACKDIFRRNLGQPLTDYFQAMIDKGEIAGDDAGFLTEHFTQTIFFTNSAILEPERAPDPATLRLHAERTVRLFLYGCKGAG